jgi:hypothetical protein
MGVAARGAIGITALVLAFPAAATGAGFDQLFGEYRATGGIDGCAHTTADLSDTLAAVPADIKAYDPGFVDALNSALERRAAGCAGVGRNLSAPLDALGTTRAVDGSPGPRTPRRLAAPIADSQAPGDGVAIVWALGIGAAAIVIGAALGWRIRGSA